MDELADTHGAVTSLLSRAYGALAGGVKLLRGVRRDVEFIKDEMESMNAFLLKIAESGVDDGHQVLAWMTQVKEVADSSDRCVHKYMDCLDGGGHGGCCGCTGSLLDPPQDRHPYPRPQGPGTRGGRAAGEVRRHRSAAAGAGHHQQPDEQASLG